MQQRTTSEWSRTVSPGGTKRVRLLIEDPSAVWFEDFARFRACGFEVAVCTGPQFGGCPLVEGDGCDLVDDADIVMWALDPREPQSRAVLRLLREHDREKPVVVRVPPAGFGDDELLGHTNLVRANASIEESVIVLRRALDGDASSDQPDLAVT